MKSVFSDEALELLRCAYVVLDDLAPNYKLTQEIEEFLKEKLEGHDERTKKIIRDS